MPRPHPLVLLPVLFALGCGPGTGPGGDCQAPADCAPTQASTCGQTCPEPATQLCLAGSCEALPEERVAVQADVMLHFSLTGQVASMVYVFIDPRQAEAGRPALDCAALASGGGASVSAAHNVLHSGFVNFQSTSGTAFFPDANLGSPPIGRALLIAQGHQLVRGGGDQIAGACVADLDLAGPGPVELSLQLDPVDG